MDDDDFDSELIGGLQRQHNLKQNEATRRELAALREDLAKKKSEEEAAPKCPYCAGPITQGVEKCRHCASDIAWGEVDNESYPIKPGENYEEFAARKRQ